MICLTLFWNFLMIGTLSFGGGYGMISLVREVVLGHGWLTESEFLSFIAVSESTPGPLAVNMATFIGSSQAGAAGCTGGYAGRGAAVLCHHPAGGGGAAQRAPVRRGTGSAGRGAPLCGGHDPGHGGHDGPFHAGRLYGRPGGRLCTGRPGHCGVCAAGAGALRVQKNTAESTIPHWDDSAFCPYWASCSGTEKGSALRLLLQFLPDVLDGHTGFFHAADHPQPLDVAFAELADAAG